MNSVFENKDFSDILKSDDENDIHCIKAGTIIIDSDGYILLVLQKNGIMSFPKGSVKFGEDLQTAAIRETLEETGLDLSAYTMDRFDIKIYHSSVYTTFIYTLPCSKDELIYNKEIEIDTLGISWIHTSTITKKFMKTIRTNKLTYNYLVENYMQKQKQKIEPKQKKE